MHPLFEKASGLTETIIAAAIEVHRDKGPGLIESIYEWCLLKELELRGLQCVSQKSVLIEYKGFTREEPLRFDVLVEGCVLVEAKAVEKVVPIHKAKLLRTEEILRSLLFLLFKLGSPWLSGQWLSTQEINHFPDQAVSDPPGACKPEPCRIEQEETEETEFLRRPEGKCSMIARITNR